MKMDKKKLAAVALLIAIALSMFGFVYSAWTDYVTINGTVNMGSLTLAFSTYESPTCTEYNLNPDPPPEWIEGEMEGKNVASCNAYYDPNSVIVDEHTGKEGYKKLIIEIENAYPGYAVHTTFIVHNIGTIPICVYGVSFTGEKRDNEGNLVYKLVAKSWIENGTRIVGEIYEDVDGSEDVSPGDILIINFKVIDDEFPFQLDPCNDNKRKIDIDFKQEAEECHTYLLYFELLGVQWNKLGEVLP